MTNFVPSKSTMLKTAVSLGLITALGPLAIDMYLPSIPQMANDLGTSYASMQLTLTVFLLALGAGQLIFGPVIDAYGRRWPLAFGIFAFIITSLWSSVSQSIDMLLYARFFQGLAASLTLVVAMSTVRDVARGIHATQLFALLMTIEGLAPVLAPALGGGIDKLFGWRGVLLTLAIFGLVVFLNSLANLPETLPPQKRSSLRLVNVFKTYREIASSTDFLIPTLALSGVFFFLFSYVGGASHVYQITFGLTPELFGLVFGATGIFVLIGAIAASRLVVRVPVPSMAVWGVGLLVIGAVIGLLSAWTGTGLTGIVVGMTLASLGIGISEATLMSIALSVRDTAFGSSTAVLGAFQLIISSIATPVAGKLSEQGPIQWLGFMVASSLVILVLTIVSAYRSAHKDLADFDLH